MLTSKPTEKLVLIKWLFKPLTLLLILRSSQAYALQEGQTAPQCPSALTDKGQKLDLTAYQGKVILIDFWATWCGPCQKSMPFLNGLRNEHLSEGFEIIAINVDENTEEAREFLKAHPVDYPVAFDPKGECAGIFNVEAMPSSFFIDKAGKVRKIHLGYRDGDQTEIREQISSLLAE